MSNLELMSEQEKKAGPEVKKRSNRLYYIIISVLVLVLALKFILDHRDRQEMQAYYDTELENAEVRLASISEELDEKIREIDSLGGTVEDLILAREELENERDQLQRTRTANRSLIQRLRAKTEGYEELLKAKDEEIEQLKALNQELFTENTELKTEKNQLSQSITELSQSKEELEGKVALASRLEVENVKVFAVAKNGRERESRFRRKQISQLKVQFDIAQNDVAPIEAKDILVRVIDPNGQLVFDVAKGSGTFMLNNKEEFFTASQTIVFDNSGQQLTYVYDKGSEYIPGEYQIQVLTDGYFMGTGNFTVR